MIKLKATFANRKDKKSPYEVRDRKLTAHKKKIAEGWAAHRQQVLNNKGSYLIPVPKWLLSANKQPLCNVISDIPPRIITEPSDQLLVRPSYEFNTDLSGHNYVKRKWWYVFFI